MNDEPRMDSRARGGLLLAVVFVAGVAVGAAIDRLAARRANSPPIATAQRPIDPEMIPRPLEVLGLSDDQKTRLHAIARQWRPRAGVALQEFGARVSDLENGMFADMVCVLTPTQQVAYRRQLQDNGALPSLIDKRFQRIDGHSCLTGER